MTDNQRYKLEQAIELIQDVLTHDATNTAILATWLGVAGDYCHEVAEDIL